MDRLIVERKLDSLRRCLDRVRERCPSDVSTLANNADLQDIVVLNLSRAVQICVDRALHMLSGEGQSVPDTMGQAFDRLASTEHISADLASRLKKAVGFRNIAVHNYSGIDWAIVHAIATRHLGDFEAFARAMAVQAAPPERNAP